LKIIRYDQLSHDFFKYQEPADVSSVHEIISDIAKSGDDALIYYTSKFDGVNIERLQIIDAEIQAAVDELSERDRQAIKAASEHIEKFAKRQLAHMGSFEYAICDDVFIGQRLAPIERIGVYIPAGRFPLVSTVLMCVIPARVAGVKSIVVCSPPRYNATVHPLILAAAHLSGAHEIYRVGGVQAVAAMAYGTSTIKRVDKIVGPGNKYVTQAKKELYGVVGIDFVAGPTEIMIIADETGRPEVIAADLLSQAEHDVEAVPILVTDSQQVAEKVSAEVERQAKDLSTQEIAVTSLKNNGLIIRVDDISQAIQIANRKAPEHLEIHVKNPGEYTSELTNFGTLFIGELSAEALGDYSSGVNHTLPTNTCARYTSGLSACDFVRLQTTVRVERNGLKHIGSVARILAEIEGLDGHARSIRIREKKQSEHN
jgi:histidinol dehydrogenase